MRRGLDAVDLRTVVSPAVVAGARELQGLLEETDELCRAGHLVTPPRTPVLREFSGWYLGQLAEQAAGAPPYRWTGPLDP